MQARNRHSQVDFRLAGMMRFAAALIAFWMVSAATVAADIEACRDMLRWTGAPAYRGDEPEHELLCRKGYVLALNVDRKVADWVLEVLTPDRLEGNAKRESGRFKTDPDIGTKGATPDDYKRSQFDRGHLAPAGDMRWDKEAMIESFYMTNMAPQVGPGFNRGIWKSLEERMRDWAGNRARLIVITGPIYGESTKTIGEAKDVAVPDAFYKIAYDPERKRAIAFLLQNKAAPTEKLPEHIVTVRDVEERTGLDFLAALPRRDQNRIETSRQPMWR